MRTLFKWLLRLVSFLVLLVLGAVLFRNPILKHLLEWRLQQATGMDTRIGYLHVGLTQPVVRIEDLKIYNPPEFGGTTFLDIPEVYLEYDRAALLWREIHLSLGRLNLAEVNVVENKEGRTNVEALMARQKQKGDSPPGGRTSASVAFAGIDRLNLTLGRARFSSLKNPGQPKEIALDVKSTELRNVRSGMDLSDFLLGLMLKHGPALFDSGPSTVTNAPAGVSKGATNSIPPSAK